MWNIYEKTLFRIKIKRRVTIENKIFNNLQQLANFYTNYRLPLYYQYINSSTI